VQISNLDERLEGNQPQARSRIALKILTDTGIRAALSALDTGPYRVPRGRVSYFGHASSFRRPQSRLNEPVH
jgi:hypothetical protein